MSGRSSPGTMYSVPTVADRLGVSTTPVREALLEISRTGLLKPFRNRGFRVEAASVSELSDLFALRGLLEGFAAKALTERHPSDPARLRSLADEAVAAVKQKDVAGYLQADRAFHAAFVDQAGNPLLTRLIMELRDSMHLYGIDSEAGRRRQVLSVNEHYQLIKLAESGVAEDTAALMSSHVLDWQPIFTAALSERLVTAPALTRSRTLRDDGHR